MKWNKKKGNEFPKTQKTRYAARAAFWSTVLCLKGFFFWLKGRMDGGREKIPGKKKYSGLWKTKGQKERERVGPSTNVPLNVIECDLWDGFS